ncbi:phage protein Gp36 family protein [Blastomonas sp.]|uniref:phage protein Gp36 family protein n=1 Tax=Blastomonas sp. TaxID=1909299 RepID=UPI0017FD4857|nr:DUF1320 domain-containing protein [Blastomonas sp.]
MSVIRRLKSPQETLVEDLGLAQAIVSVTSEARGLVSGSASLDLDDAIVAGRASLSIGGGSDGELYLITALLDTIGGDRDAQIELAVLDGSWTMPGGGAPMLSIEAFVDRFGLDEIILLTDAGDGRIDRKMLIGALSDAQAQAEAYLADRYTLPLATVPQLVEMAIADIAHARLYRREVPKNVEDAQRIAMRNLEAIGSGKIKLGIPLAPSTSSDPVLIAPGRPVYGDRLKGYVR